MINNIWFKIIAGKINKIAEFYTIFARKMPDYIIRHFGLEDLTSLIIVVFLSVWNHNSLYIKQKR